MSKTMSYRDALAQVEAILERINAEDLDIDTLAAEVKRASELIKFCRERLAKAEKEVNEVLEGKD